MYNAGWHKVKPLVKLTLFHSVSWYQETAPMPFPDPNRFLPYWIHTSGANKSVSRNLSPISHQNQLVLEILGSSWRRACLIYFFYSETIVGSCNLEDWVLELVDQSWGEVGGWILFVSFEIEGKKWVLWMGRGGRSLLVLLLLLLTWWWCLLLA